MDQHEEEEEEKKGGALFACLTMRADVRASQGLLGLGSREGGRWGGLRERSADGTARGRKKDKVIISDRPKRWRWDSGGGVGAVGVSPAGL